MNAMLTVTDLTVSYQTSQRKVKALQDCSLSVGRGVALGVVGESGCGKSTLVKSISRLLPTEGKIDKGSIRWGDYEITSMPEKALDRLRWKKLALVPQSAINSLNPVYRISDQMKEVLARHESLSARQMRERIATAFETVGLDPARMDSYPHQFSGGMRQRVVIAMATLLNPEILVADEPTTALDSVSQKRVLATIRQVQQERRLAMLYITHDVGVAAAICDELAVMYGGRIVEHGPTKEIISSPRHPYTMGLLGAVPSLRAARPLISIGGTPPLSADDLPGCGFEPRCPFSIDGCREKPPELEEVGHSRVRCIRYPEADKIRFLAARAEKWEAI